MSDTYIDFLDDPSPGWQPGDLGQNEEWWAERQQVWSNLVTCFGLVIVQVGGRHGPEPISTFFNSRMGSLKQCVWTTFRFSNRAHDLQGRLVMDATDPDIGRQTGNVEKAPHEGGPL